MKLGGKYELGEVLGSGGMGKVWAAVHQSSNGFTKRCVVKVLHPELSARAELVELFQQEARLAGQMAHPGIPQVFDHGVEDGQAYFVMELVEGPTLHQVISRLRFLKRQPPPAIAARIIASVAEALAYAHELTDDQGVPLGLIHRDVSPDNVMIDQNGVTKLTDFGVARVLRSSVNTAAGSTRGKVRYMSPEQLAAAPLSPRSDVFAMGVVLCELLTLQHPWSGASDSAIMLQVSHGEAPRPPLTLRGDLPPALVEIIRSAIEPAADDRTANCRVVQRALERFITSTGRAVTNFDVAQWLKTLDAEAGSNSALFTLPHTHTTDGRVMKAARRSRVWVGAAISAALISVGVAAAFLLPGATRPPMVATAAITPAILAPAETPIVVAPAPEAEAEPDPEPLSDGPVSIATPPGRTRPARKAMGTVELRIRPWAMVVVDGAPMGETPMSDLQLSVGRHSVRLVNRPLGKDVSIPLQVRSGHQQLKYNLNSP